MSIEVQWNKIEQGGAILSCGSQMGRSSGWEMREVFHGVVLAQGQRLLRHQGVVLHMPSPPTHLPTSKNIPYVVV